MTNALPKRSALKTAFEAAGAALACVVGENPYMGLVSAGNFYEIAKTKIKDGINNAPPGSFDAPMM